ncbi:MAPEG family protein [Pantanalinema rosaneae CENA516]|uniref:MAPEG family protein n=1 Tax=Pantanalinema rosaneae TaxID=1620701 RepID=UPI003D6F5BC2
MKIEQSTSLAIAEQLSMPPMTVPLWGLVIFILWTIAVVVLLLMVRIRHLAAGGSPKDFAVMDDNHLMWRLFRVQANLVENLPLYLGVIFLLTVRGLSGGIVDLLVGIYITFRLLHSIVHIAGADPRLRILSLAAQFSCLISLIVLVILS